MQTPILTMEPPRSGVGQGHATVFIAVLTIPEARSLLFCNTVLKALSAALRRNSVPVIQEGELMSDVFSVASLDVPWQSRGAALDTVKTTLEELELLPRATIAVNTADDTQLCVHGLDLGGVGFGEMFLRPEFFEQTRAAIEKFKMDLNALTAALRARVKRLKESMPAASPENNPPRE